MKLLLDMHISAEVAARLRRDGTDVFQLRERGLQRMPDVDIVALAAAESRVIVTYDLDFSAVLARTGADRPSVIQFRLNDTRAETVEYWLRTLMPLYANDLAGGCLLSVATDRIRVRRLPFPRR